MPLSHPIETALPHPLPPEQRMDESRSAPTPALTPEPKFVWNEFKGFCVEVTEVRTDLPATETRVVGSSIS